MLVAILIINNERERKDDQKSGGLPLSLYGNHSEIAYCTLLEVPGIALSSVVIIHSYNTQDVIFINQLKGTIK